jgi:DNA repair protein RadA
MVELELENVKGVTDEMAKKLKDKGIFTIEALAISTPRDLFDTVGEVKVTNPKTGREGKFNEDIARQIIGYARDKCDIKFVTAKELMKEREGLRFLTTGVSSIDNLLGGGFESMSMTELAGGFGSGKTQLATQACVTVQLPEEQGGMNGGAIFLDTESTFRPDNVVRYAKKFDLAPSKVMDKILVADVFNSSHQMLLVRQLDKQIKQIDARLIVVDSLTSHFRSEYIGRETLPLRQQELNQHMHKLLSWAKAFKIPVVITNQVHATPAQVFTFAPELLNPPIGGHVLAHTATHRLYLWKGKEPVRLIKAFDSPNLPPDTARFAITGEGPIDVKEEKKEGEKPT